MSTTLDTSQVTRTNPPSLPAVVVVGDVSNELSLVQLLNNPTLSLIYRWYLVSLYVPENFLFRENVARYEMLFAEDPPDMFEVRRTLKKIIADYVAPDSPNELSLPSRMRASLCTTADRGDTPEANFFAAAAAEVDKDLIRTLPNFCNSDIFTLYRQHEEAFERFVGMRGEISENTTLVRGDRKVVMEHLRAAFKTDTPVVIKGIVSEIKEYPYAVYTHQGHLHAGWANQMGNFFYFYDYNGTFLLKVSAAALMGLDALPTVRKGSNRRYSVAALLNENRIGEQWEALSTGANLKQKRRPLSITIGALEDDDDDDGMDAGSGCCAMARVRRGAAAGNAAVEIEERTWYVKDHTETAHGPFLIEELQLMWRFHVLIPQLSIRNGENGAWTTVADAEPATFKFVPTTQLQLIDPTNLKIY